MKGRSILFFLTLTALLFSGCKKKDYSFNLFYTSNYEGDSWQNHRTGLLWAMSYLGAELPPGSLDKAILWKDSTSFSFSIHQLGFSESAVTALNVIIDSIKQMEYYKTYDKADLGQFISLTIGSSWHYYKITGVPKTLGEFKKLHRFSDHKIFPVSRSTVAKHQRMIIYPAQTGQPSDWFFLAEEGHGNIGDKTFSPGFYEVFDVMNNGQLRFAVYNKEGLLSAASPKEFGEAGKPAKCLWCHEIVVQPLFIQNDSVPGFISSEEFQRDMTDLMEALTKYRSGLKSDVDFNKTQDHTQMELEYISFMQPSARRLSQEWGLTLSETQAMLDKIKTTEYEEFKFLGALYQRKELKRFNHVIPESIREPGNTEPDFFK